MSSLCYSMMSMNILTIDYQGKKIHNARYIDWIVNTPIQMIILGKMGKLSIPNIYILCFLTIMMVIYGWIGELIQNYLKWILFSEGMIVMIPIYIFLFEDFNYEVVKEFSGDFIARKFYWMGKALLSIWFAYPIIWILDNVNLISQLTVSISYSISDFISKFIFTLWMFYCIKNSYYVGETMASLEFEEN